MGRRVSGVRSPGKQQGSGIAEPGTGTDRNRLGIAFLQNCQWGSPCVSELLGTVLYFCIYFYYLYFCSLIMFIFGCSSSFEIWIIFDSGILGLWGRIQIQRVKVCCLTCVCVCWINGLVASSSVPKLRCFLLPAWIGNTECEIQFIKSKMTVFKSCV